MERLHKLAIRLDQICVWKLAITYTGLILEVKKVNEEWGSTVITWGQLIASKNPEGLIVTIAERLKHET